MLGLSETLLTKKGEHRHTLPLEALRKRLRSKDLNRLALPSIAVETINGGEEEDVVDSLLRVFVDDSPWSR
jgi:hypothetical protein